jgi:hypothetical protein
MFGPVAASASPAGDLVRSALDAQGGAAQLGAIGGVRLRAMMLSNALEQSVRPEGPWFENYSDIVETRRFDQPALRVEARSRGYRSDFWVNAHWAESITLVTGGAAFTVAGGRLEPASAEAADAAELSLALGPERALLTAAVASDLHLEPAANLHGQRHDVIGFTWHRLPVRIFLTPSSHMPAAVEIVRPRPYDIAWSGWGDVDTRVEWEFWTREPNGIRYPRRWTMTSNGKLEQSRMIDQIEFDPAIVPGSMQAEPALIARASGNRRPVADARFASGSGREIAPGIRLFEGAWNVIEVIQPDGVYVVEAPISSGYSAGVIASARQGGRRLLGMVSTSDSWPHIGGLRQYVSEGIPVIALDLNRPLIEAFVAAPHRSMPDDLARHPRPPRLRLVERTLTIGQGEGAMRIIPMRTVSGERQMAIYWPAHRLLYTSDIMAPMGEGIWLPQYRDEVGALIRREGLDVARVFGMHYGPVSWESLRNLGAPSPQS